MNTWKTERTGWRDAALSDRHGHWGFHCPAVDIDFLMVEYHYGKPCALIDYKHKNAVTQKPDHPNFRAIVALADGYKEGPLPCFIARYDPAMWSFQVTPLNATAREYYARCKGEWISERRFVKSLHLLRKAVLLKEDESAIAALNDTTPLDVVPQNHGS